MSVLMIHTTPPPTAADPNAIAWTLVLNPMTVAVCTTETSFAMVLLKKSFENLNELKNITVITL
jgi:hypothetical protein